MECMECAAQEFKQALFEYGGNSKFCELLSFEILAHCNSTDALIRSKAASMFYLFLKVDAATPFPTHAHTFLTLSPSSSWPFFFFRKTGKRPAICRACRCSRQWPCRDSWAA
jgi:hypothetical protein